MFKTSQAFLCFYIKGSKRENMSTDIPASYSREISFLWMLNYSKLQTNFLWGVLGQAVLHT